jgi:hypothetical protein
MSVAARTRARGSLSLRTRSLLRFGPSALVLEDKRRHLRTARLCPAGRGAAIFRSVMRPPRPLFSQVMGPPNRQLRMIATEGHPAERSLRAVVVEQMSAALHTYVDQLTDRVLADVFQGDGSEAPEVAAPPQRRRRGVSRLSDHASPVRTGAGEM